MSIIDEISFKYKRKDKKNMDEKLKNAIALFRYGTLSPLITGQTEFKDPWTYFRNNEGKKFEYIDGTYRTICPSTLDRWYKAYKEKGFDGLKPQGRSDIGIQRKIDDELKNITGDLIDAMNPSITPHQDNAKVLNETWKCPKCGTDNITSKFCPECGEPMPMNWNCPDCGTKNIETKFCPNCGRKKTVIYVKKNII